MNPADLSARLRSVADRLDASRRPSRDLVAAELRSVLASVAAEKDPGCTCAPGVVNAACPVHGDGYREPGKVSSALRSISERILASRSPSRSAVALELKRVLAAMSHIAVGPTKVFVSEEWWDVNEVRKLMEEVGGSDLRECEYGLFGFVAPASAAAQLQAEPGVSAVDSWEEANGTDPNLDFQPVDAPSPGDGKPPPAVL